MESVRCDAIKIRLKRSIATRSVIEYQPLNIKTAVSVELPILKLGLLNFSWSFYFILLLVASLLFRRIFMTLFSASFESILHSDILKMLKCY